MNDGIFGVLRQVFQLHEADPDLSVFPCILDFTPVDIRGQDLEAHSSGLG